jgi:hypothetical protein
MGAPPLGPPARLSARQSCRGHRRRTTHRGVFHSTTYIKAPSALGALQDILARRLSDDDVAASRRRQYSHVPFVVYPDALARYPDMRTG